MKNAVLFGLNYNGQNEQLSGCDRDALNVREYLVFDRGYDKVKVYTEDKDTSLFRIIHKIYRLAMESWRLGLDEACIYFSGHGSSLERSWRSYNRNWTDDEMDGRDECLVPTDWARSGVIPDNYIKYLLKHFNP